MTHSHTVLRYNRIPFHTEAGEDILQRVERHWEKMREGEQIPARATFAPEPLEAALSHCFVLERVAPEIARFRVAGRDLTTLLGMEARGMPLSTLFTEDGKQAIGPLIEQIVEGPHIVEVPLTSSRGFARLTAKGRLLMLPLSDRDGEPTRIFGALVTDSKPGRGNWRFQLDEALPLRCKRVSAYKRRAVTPTIPTPPIATPPAEVAVGHNKVVTAIDTHLKQRPALRLVVDNTAN